MHTKDALAPVVTDDEKARLAKQEQAATDAQLAVRNRKIRRTQAAKDKRAMRQRVRKARKANR